MHCLPIACGKHQPAARTFFTPCPRPALLEDPRLRDRFLPGPRQLELDFGPPPARSDAVMALTGQL